MPLNRKQSSPALSSTSSPSMSSTASFASTSSFGSKFSSALKSLTRSPTANRRKVLSEFTPVVPPVPLQYQPQSILKRNKALPPSNSDSTISSGQSNITSARDWDSSSSNGTYSSPDTSPESIKRANPIKVSFQHASPPALQSINVQPISSPPFDESLERAAASSPFDNLVSRSQSSGKSARIPSMRFDDLTNFITDLQRSLYASDGSKAAATSFSSLPDIQPTEEKLLTRRKRVSSLQPLLLSDRKVGQAYNSPAPNVTAFGIFSPRLADSPSMHLAGPPVMPEVRVQPPTPDLGAGDDFQPISKSRLPRVNRIPKRSAVRPTLGPAAVILSSEGSRTPPLSPASTESSLNHSSTSFETASNGSSDDGEEQISNMLHRLNQPLSPKETEEAFQEPMYQILPQEDPRSKLTDFNLKLHTASVGVQPVDVIQPYACRPDTFAADNVAMAHLPKSDSGDLGLAIVTDEDEDEEELDLNSSPRARDPRRESLWDLESAVVCMGDRVEVGLAL